MCKKVSIIRGTRKRDKEALESLLKDIGSTIEVTITSDVLNVLNRSSELPYIMTDDGLRFFGIQGVKELIAYLREEKGTQELKAV